MSQGNEHWLEREVATENRGEEARDGSSQTQWELILTELRAYRDEQQQAWGGVDDMAIARYLAGECTGREREQVEELLAQFPDVAECVNLVREVLGDLESAA